MQCYRKVVAEEKRGRVLPMILITNFYRDVTLRSRKFEQYRGCWKPRQNIVLLSGSVHKFELRFLRKKQ